MRDFDRRFNRMRKFVVGFIATVFVLLIAYFITIGVIAGKVISDPEGTAEKVGEVARSWKDAFEKGYKVETVDESDTTSVFVVDGDTLNVK